MVVSEVLGAADLETVVRTQHLTNAFVSGINDLFCFALNGARTEHDWPVSKSAKVMIAALLPFGPFVIDHGLKEEDTTYVDA